MWGVFGDDAPAERRPVGQLVIEVPGAPFGMRPGDPSNRLFASEIEHLDEAWQLRALTALADLGGTDLVIGAGAGEYRVGGQLKYPATDWRDPGQRASILRAVKAWTENYGGTLTLTVAPDLYPYWLGAYQGWDIGLIDAHFGDVYLAILQTGRVRKLRHGWEIIARALRRNGEQWAPMQRIFRYMGDLVRRAGLDLRDGFIDFEFHTPDDHMWPGLSYDDGSEEDQAKWAFAAGCNVIGQQRRTDADDANVTYDIKDCLRRIKGIPVDLHDGKGNVNPWGNSAPLLDCYGREVQCDFEEQLAEPFFKFEGGVTQADLDHRATVAIAAGARESGDGIPEAA